MGSNLINSPPSDFNKLSGGSIFSSCWRKKSTIMVSVKWVGFGVGLGVSVSFIERAHLRTKNTKGRTRGSSSP